MDNKEIPILLSGVVLGVAASFIYAMTLTGVTSLTELNARLGVIKAEHVAKLAAEQAELKQKEEEAENARIAAEQEQRRIEAEENAKKEKQFKVEWDKLSARDKDRWYERIIYNNHQLIIDCSREGGHPYIVENGTNVLITGAWSYDGSRGSSSSFQYSIAYANGMSNVQKMYGSYFPTSEYRGLNYSDLPMRVKCAGSSNPFLNS